MNVHQGNGTFWRIRNRPKNPSVDSEIFCYKATDVKKCCIEDPCRTFRFSIDHNI